MEQASPVLTQAPALDTLRIQLLGDFRVTVGEARVGDAAWKLAKARSVVKLLALTPEHALHRDQVVELLWPDIDPETAVEYLHQALHFARRAFKRVVPTGNVLHLPRQSQVLSLDPPEGLWVDVDAFEQAARAAGESGEPSAYHQAIELYTGDLLLADLYEDWVAPRRAELRDTLLTLLLNLSARYRQRGDLMPAIDALRQVVTLDTTHEESHAELMRLYARSGMRQQALRQFERLRETLEHELGVPPSDTTIALYQHILAEETATQPHTVPSTPVVAPPAGAAATRGALVNRTRELGLAQECLDQAFAGRGWVVLLTGEPGIGKTRVAEEIAERAAQRGALVLWGRCFEHQGAPGYWPWIQIVRDYAREHDAATTQATLGSGAADLARIVPELHSSAESPVPRSQAPTRHSALGTRHASSTPLDPQLEQFRLLDSLATFLGNAAQRRPLVLVLDDLQWADRSSLLALEFVAETVRANRLLVVGTYRESEVDRQHPLTRALVGLHRTHVDKRIHLSGLSEADVARLSTLAIGAPPPDALVSAVYRQTNGNPLFVEEVVRLLVDEGRLEQQDSVQSWTLTVPPSVRETIGLRLAALSATAIQVLETAAVVGTRFELAVLAQACALSRAATLEALDEAITPGMLRAVPDTVASYEFAHGLLPQTLYEELSAGRRLRTHLRVAEAIEQVCAANLAGHLRDLAHHYSQAAPLGHADKAIAYARRAGDQAMASVAYAAAIGDYQQARAACEQYGETDPALFCEILLKLGQAQANAGELPAARETLLEAAGVARASHAIALLARAAIEFEAVGRYLEVWDEAAVRLLEEALAAESGIDERRRALLRARLSDALAGRSDMDERRRTLCREAVALARAEGDPETLALALLERLHAEASVVRVEDQLADADEVLALAERAGSARLRQTVHAWRILYLVRVGAVPRAALDIEAYAALAAESRHPHARWSSLTHQTMRALIEGDFATAEQRADEALTLGRGSVGASATLAHFIHLFSLRREQGRLAELEDAAREMAAKHPGLPLVQYLLALLYLDLHRADAARRALGSDAACESVDLPDNTIWLPSMALMAEATSALGDRPRAATLYAQLLPHAAYAANGGNSLFYGPVAHFLGLLAASLQNWDSAIDHFDAALELAKRMGARPSIARTELASARTLLARNAAGDQRAAARLLHQAASTARELSMARVLREISSTAAAIPHQRTGASLT